MLSRHWLATVALPLVLLGLLLAAPAVDAIWENHQAHFWLVLAAAATATALGYTVNAAARARRDARLLLISCAFIASSGFLGLHALATPGVGGGARPAGSSPGPGRGRRSPPSRGSAPAASTAVVVPASSSHSSSRS